MLQYYPNPINYEKNVKKHLETIQLSPVEEKTILKIFLPKISKRPKYSVFSITLYIICQAKKSLI